MTNLRLDEHTCISEGPTAVPGVSGLHASVFRPFNDESRAREYATEVRDWFAESGCPASVFVVRGPTSTARTAFEVVNASAGYTIVFTASPPAVPSPQEFSQQKGALEDRLAQHAILRQSGAIDDCFWMRHFLRELLVGHGSQLPQDTPYASTPCSQVFTDLMVGRHGLEVLLEATLVLEGDFIRIGLDQDFITTSLAFAHRALGKAGLLGEPQNPSPIYQGLDAGGLLTSLMTHEYPWTDAPIIELLKGRFGTRFRDNVALSMVDGIASDAFIGSFVRTCISRGRIELLHAVADLGMPDALKNYEAANRSKEATGPGGQWLDVLANHSQRGAHPAHRTTFAAQIGAFSKSPIAKDLADILVKHDLGHLGIEAMRGTLGHAIVIESMLRSRLEHTSASTELHAAVAPAARARRATL